MLKITERLWGSILKKGATPLPLEYVLITFMAEMVNGLTRTSVFAYLPRLVQELGVSEKRTGTYVGYAVSSMMFSASIFSFLIGYFTDRFNKKYVIVCGCAYGSLLALIFGFSNTMTMLIVVRCLQGAPCIPIPGLAILFEKCDSTNKSAAMTITTVGFNIGQVLGPIIGGFLAFPVENISKTLKGTPLERYPILLPNLVISICLASLAISISFVDYTPSEDYSELISDEIDVITEEKTTKQDRNGNISPIQKDKRPKLIQVLSNKNAMLICISFAVFGFFADGFNEMFPVWASTTFLYNGLQFSTKNIGQSVLIASIPLIFLQFAVLSKLTQRFPVKKIYIVSVMAQTVLYIVFPKLNLIQNKRLLWFALCLMILIIRLAVGVCFMAVNVLLNSSVGNELLGTVNGLGWTSASFMSASAPTVFGIMYSWSLGNVKGVPSNQHPLGFPFDNYFVFSIMSIFCIIDIFIILFIKDLSKNKV